MAMIRFENPLGGAVWVTPEDVRGVKQSIADGCAAIVYDAARQTSDTVKGDPDAVLKRILAGTVDARSVLQQAWNETWGYDDQSGSSMAHTERVLLLRLAEMFSIKLDTNMRTTAEGASTP